MLATTDPRTRSLFIVHIAHHDGTERTVRVRAHSVHGALARALNGGRYWSAEVCNASGEQLAVYDAVETE